LPIHFHHVVEVRARAAAGIAERRDPLAALDDLPRLHVERLVVPVLRAHAVAVIDDQAVAERAVLAREYDPAAGWGDHVGARSPGDVDARVELLLIGERRDAIAERRSQPALRGPDRGRRLEPLALALERVEQVLQTVALPRGDRAEIVGGLVEQAHALQHARAGRNRRQPRVAVRGCDGGRRLLDSALSAWLHLG